jgi:hypothetical protein
LRQALVLQFEELHEFAARDVTGFVEGLGGQSASLAISEEIGSEGIVELTSPHATLVFLLVYRTHRVHGDVWTRLCSKNLGCDGQLL